MGDFEADTLVFVESPVKYHPCRRLLLTLTAICRADREIQESNNSRSNTYLSNKLLYLVITTLVHVFLIREIDLQFPVRGPCLVGSLTGAVAS